MVSSVSAQGDGAEGSVAEEPSVEEFSSEEPSAEEPSAEEPSAEEFSSEELSSEEQEARVRFNAGQMAYDSRRFEDALRDFRRAYQLSGREPLLYNIGLAADRLRRDAEALEAFRHFVAALPDHPRAPWVRERIEQLQPQEPAPDTPVQVADPGPNAGAWVLGGSGLVMSGVGATLLGFALADRNAIEGLTSPQPWPDLERRAETVTRRSGVGLALIGAGVAAALGALLWSLLVRTDAPVRASLGPGQLWLEAHF